ncbi:MAG TPA: MBL fold metallo-hydrolase [Candidatus Anoxymicrobiaceae bacterium]|jgi:glyoxylase-like metal-dependent hydrolase (beta-lactamase superfamily II)
MATGELSFIAGDNRARFPDSNCLFIDDEKPAIIDPATKRARLEALHREKAVQFVVNTHYHVDHTRYDPVFSPAQIVANAIDAPAIEDLDELARATGVDGVPWLPAWKRTIRERWEWTEKRVTRTVDDGDTLSLGANTLRFIHTPGHTAGHTCVEFVEKNAVFLADIDLGKFGPWYANRGSDIDAFLASIERLKTVQAETWYMSHGEGVLHGDISGRLDAFARVIHGREERLAEFLTEPRTFDEIVAQTIVYGRRWEPPQLFELFEGMMVGKHLARLERAGLIERDAAHYRAVR